MYSDPNILDGVIGRPAAAAIADKLFAYINGSDQIALALDGGYVYGVTVSEVTAALDEVGIYTGGHGGVEVKCAGTVTAGHEVMVSSGKAIDATVGGGIAVGFAETAGSATINARIILYPPNAKSYGTEKIAKKSNTGAAIHGGVQAWQNPESVSILITKIVHDITTKSTGAATLDTGTTATSATTASDTLIDGLDISVTENQWDNTVNGGTNGKGAQKLASAKWVTFKEATGDTTGAVIDSYIYYTLLA